MRTALILSVKLDFHRRRSLINIWSCTKSRTHGSTAVNVGLTRVLAHLRWITFKLRASDREGRQKPELGLTTNSPTL